MKTCLTLASAVLCAGLSGPAAADSFRCKTFLIDEDMPAAEIAEKCGPADSIETVEQPIRARGANGASREVGVTTIHYWTYDLGPGRPQARLTIEEGIAIRIEMLPR